MQPLADAETVKVRTGSRRFSLWSATVKILLLVEQGVTVAGRVFTFHRDGVITGDEEMAIVRVGPTRGTAILRRIFHASWR